MTLQHLHVLWVPISSDSQFVHAHSTVLLCEAPSGVLSSAFPCAATCVSVCETPNRGMQTRCRYIYSYHFWSRLGHCGPIAGHLRTSTQLPTLLQRRFGYDELGGLPYDTTVTHGETSVGADQLRYQLATEVWYLALQTLSCSLFLALSSRRLRQVRSKH